MTPPRSSQVWRHDGMVVRYIDVETLKHETPMLAVGVFEGTETPSGWLEIIDRALGGAILRVLSSGCLLYTSPSPRDKRQSRMPSSA